MSSRPPAGGDRSHRRLCSNNTVTLVPHSHFEKQMNFWSPRDPTSMIMWSWGLVDQLINNGFKTTTTRTPYSNDASNRALRESSNGSTSSCSVLYKVFVLLARVQVHGGSGPLTSGRSSRILFFKPESYAFSSRTTFLYNFIKPCAVGVSFTTWHQPTLHCKYTQYPSGFTIFGAMVFIIYWISSYIIIDDSYL